MQSLSPAQSLWRWERIVRRQPPSAAALGISDKTENAKDCFEQKRRPYERKRGRGSSVGRSDEIGPSSDDVDGAEVSTSADPFACSDLSIPSTLDVVERVLEEGIAKWKDLDDRKIALPPRPRYSNDAGDGTSDSQKNAEGSAAVEDQAHTVEASRPHTHRKKKKSSKSIPGFGDHRSVRLPDGFDYECRRGPPVAHDGGSSRPQAISLLDPSKPLDYEAELWHIFNELPTEQHLQHRGTSSQGVVFCAGDIPASIEGAFRNAYGHSEFYSASRYRQRERHHLPVSSLCPEKSRGATAANSNHCHNAAPKPSIVDSHQCVVRVECWRRHLKRGSSADNHKLEMEFLATQSLKEVHDAIVHNATDTFCPHRSGQQRHINRGGRKFTEAASKSSHTTGETRQDERSTQTSTQTERTSASSCSGVFFIEGTFYVTGDVDYSQPILRWLRQNSCDGHCDGGAGMKSQQGEAFLEADHLDVSEERVLNRNRLRFLGIPSNVRISVDMEATKLQDISVRKGVRYLHVHDGDCECSVFFTDVRCGLSSLDQNNVSFFFPVFHDTWSSSGAVPECAGCQHSTPVIATVHDELADGQPATPLCEGCYLKLHYTQDGEKALYDNFRAYPFKLLQDHADNSVEGERPSAVF